MDHKQRVQLSINKKEPDRVPIDLGGPISGITKTAYDNLVRHLGFRELRSTVCDLMQGLADLDEKVLKHFDVDFRHVRVNSPRKEEVKEGEDWLINEFGIMLKKQYHGYYYEIVEDRSPLYKAKGIEDIEAYKPPEPHDGRFNGLGKLAKKLDDNGYAVTVDSFTAGIMELALWLRGFNKFYYDLAANPEFSNALLSKTLEIHKRFWAPFLAEVGDYATIVLCADDYGHQEGLLVSPALWRRSVKPRLRELITFIRRLAKSAKIQFHSCGSVEPIIGELAEVGVDILNPIQPRAKDMDSRHLVEKYDKRICYHGGIDVQYILPEGKAIDVEEEVKRRIRDLALGGGYILAAAHNIQPDVPPQNIEMMFKAAHKYGKYPIDS